MRKRSKLFTKLAFGVLVSIAVFISCQTQDESITPEIDNFESSTEGKMVLGKQLENPYSVENMRKALASLTANGRTASDFDIKTTDLYVRFIPKDSLELDALEDYSQIDTTFNLFDHPLDFEIEEVGHWYHDPAILDHLPTYQYTVVKPDFVFSDTLDHEVLAELFIPDELEGDADNGRIAVDLDFLYDLEDEALRMTDNWEEPVTDSDENGRINGRRSKWNPRGRIMVEERIGNTDRGDVPLRYCKVRARRWFTVATANTSVSNGTFYISRRFRRDVNYSLKFETYKHKVTNWIGSATTHNGPKRKGDWNMNIAYNNASETWVRATLMNAIYHFRTQASRHKLKLPGFFTTVKVRGVFKSGRSNAIGVVRHIPLGANSLIFRNDVKIYTKTSRGTQLKTDNFYSLMMHELGHVSHALKSPVNSILSLGIVNESFATAVEYYFTLPYYPNDVDHLIDQSRTEIEDGSDDSWKYSPFFIDMIDDSNQRDDNNNSTDYANDNVSGYTLEQIQKALDRRTTIGGVCKYLQDNYSNSTEGNLDELADFYQSIKDDN